MLWLFGDSHALAFREALGLVEKNAHDELAEAFGEVRAGMIATAGALLRPFHTKDGSRIVFIEPEAAQRFAAITGSADGITADHRGPLLLCVGFHFLKVMKMPMWARFSLSSASEKQFITGAVFTEFLKYHNAAILEFAKDLVSLGLNVIFVESPPLKERVKTLPLMRMSGQEVQEFDKRYRRTMRGLIHSIGARVHACPESVHMDGFLKPEFETIGDNHHANAKYGILLWNEILRIRNKINDSSVALDSELRETLNGSVPCREHHRMLPDGKSVGEAGLRSE